MFLGIALVACCMFLVCRDTPKRYAFEREREKGNHRLDGSSWGSFPANRTSKSRLFPGINFFSENHPRKKKKTALGVGEEKNQPGEMDPVFEKDG